MGLRVWEVPIPFAVIEAGLNPYALVVYVYLTKHSHLDANGLRTCFPSLRDISVESGIALSTVRKNLRELESKGFVKITERFNYKETRRGQDSHLFTLTPPESQYNEPLAERLTEISRDTGLSTRAIVGQILAEVTEYRPGGSLRRWNSKA